MRVVLKAIGVLTHVSTKPPTKPSPAVAKRLRQELGNRTEHHKPTAAKKSIASQATPSVITRASNTGRSASNPQTSANRINAARAKRGAMIAVTAATPAVPATNDNPKISDSWLAIATAAALART